MDKSLREHLFLTSLRKLNRDYITKETTSLLMKELDELRSSASSGSTIVTAGGVATSGAGGPIYHKTSTASTRSFKANNGAVVGAKKSADSVLADQHYRNNLEADGAIATKNDTHSVAKAIIQAVKSRGRKDKALSVPNAYTINKKNPFWTSNQQPVLNGHATEEEISQISNQNPTLIKSPVISKSNRLTKRFQLDLKTPLFSSSRLRRKSGLNRTSSLETAPNAQQQKQSTGTIQGKSPPKGSNSLGGTPAKKENKEENEHGLIAYKSALLQVTPSASPQSSVLESPPSPTASGHPTQVQVNLKAKKALPTSSAENSPKPGPSRANIDSRPHSVGTMHEGPPCTSNSIENDSISINDDLTVIHTGTVPRDHTITTGHFSAITDVGTAMPACCASCSPSTESFLRFRNQYCTSYRLKVASLRNPVDACLLPNDCLAIADYDNGFLVLSPGGDVVKHCLPMADGKNACGVACSTADSEFRLLVLAYKDGAWSVNVYDWTFELTETIPCPQDPQIETWALRKIVLAPPIGGCYMEDSNVEISNDSISSKPPSCALYLMASGETKSTIWAFDFTFREWKMIVSENSRRGAYNDLSIKFDPQLKETHFLLCDWKKAQLGTVVVNDRLELVDNQTIKIRRVKGQEWIVQGPKLSVWDEHSNILVYDGSGKLFLFDGDNYKCKKVVGDLGKGEISALVVRDGWCYALCRYRLCIEAFLYNEMAETSL